MSTATSTATSRGNPAAGAFLSVSEQGCIEGSVFAPNVILNGIVKGDIEAGDRVELGVEGACSGQCSLHRH